MIEPRYVNPRPAADDVARMDLADFARPPAWYADALCPTVGMEDFFPGAGEETIAKAACGRCPVAVQCLEYAISNNEQWGIWGGLNTSERKRLARKCRPNRIELDGAA